MQTPTSSGEQQCSTTRCSLCTIPQQTSRQSSITSCQSSWPTNSTSTSVVTSTYWRIYRYLTPRTTQRNSKIKFQLSLNTKKESLKFVKPESPSGLATQQSSRTPQIRQKPSGKSRPVTAESRSTPSVQAALSRALMISPRISVGHGLRSVPKPILLRFFLKEFNPKLPESNSYTA